MSEEIWVDLIEYPGYQISTGGNIMSPNGRVLKKRPNGNVMIWDYRKELNPARLVIGTFTGVWDDEKVIRFKDGDKTNASFANVELVTRTCKRGHPLAGLNHYRNQCWSCQKAHQRVDCDADELYEELVRTGERPVLPPGRRSRDNAGRYTPERGINNHEHRTEDGPRVSSGVQSPRAGHPWSQRGTH